MKLKYFMTIPLGYLILFFSQRFGLYETRYDMPVLLEEFIYVSLDIFAVLFFVYPYNIYIYLKMLVLRCFSLFIF